MAKQDLPAPKMPKPKYPAAPKKEAARRRDNSVQSISDWIRQEFKVKNIGRANYESDIPMDEEVKQNYVQWTTSDDKTYFPASRSVGALDPGIYEIRPTGNGGLYFARTPLSTEGLIRFPETNSELVVKEIETFWEREEMFKDYKLAFKRGILLYGPPGSGKTCTIKMAVHDIIKREGIVVKFCHPGIFSEGMRIFREIEPQTRVICLMEDIDAIIETFNESDVVNVLDGVDMIDKIVFIATTNYPERLCNRILNRPSRFDKRFLIGMPNEESRKIYLQSLLGKKCSIDVDQWVKDTDGFSIAHLKELFVAVEILGNKYKAALETLRTMMSEKLSSDTYGETIGL